MNSNLEKEVNSPSKTDAAVEDNGGNQVCGLFLINLQQGHLGTYWHVKLVVCLLHKLRLLLSFAMMLTDYVHILSITFMH